MLRRDNYEFNGFTKSGLRGDSIQNIGLSFLLLSTELDRREGRMTDNTVISPDFSPSSVHSKVLFEISMGATGSNPYHTATLRKNEQKNGIVRSRGGFTYTYLLCRWLSYND